MYPTEFQKKMLWVAITAASFLAIAAIVWFVGRIVVQGVVFLDPVLIPVAVAWILTYLLNPVVAQLQKWKFSRLWAVITLFVSLLLIVGGIGAWVGPSLAKQVQTFSSHMPSYVAKAHGMVNQAIETFDEYTQKTLGKGEVEEEVDATASLVKTTLAEVFAEAQKGIPQIGEKIGNFLKSNAEGGWRMLDSGLRMLGTILSLLLVPIFLFFFLMESPNIGQHWAKYLPLRASKFKDEVVSLLTEINGYLISFFRGQFLVSMIDGTITGICLLILGLDFALLIGLMIGILALIPYVGIFICWIPAVIIAAAQFGDWYHPLIVTVIFIGVNYLEGIFISPKIVGDSVGLHPLTVILSVLAWGVVFGGALGALLAVPLTATFKVILKRYFWDRPAV